MTDPRASIAERGSDEVHLIRFTAHAFDQLAIDVASNTVRSASLMSSQMDNSTRDVGV